MLKILEVCCPACGQHNRVEQAEDFVLVLCSHCAFKLVRLRDVPQSRKSIMIRRADDVGTIPLEKEE